jgi:hypothetical protein
VFILSRSFNWKESGKESVKESDGIPSPLSGLFGWKESGLSLFRFFEFKFVLVGFYSLVVMAFS